MQPIERIGPLPRLGFRALSVALCSGIVVSVGFSEPLIGDEPSEPLRVYCCQKLSSYPPFYAWLFKSCPRWTAEDKRIRDYNIAEKTRHCPSCGYDLRASEGKCPECGKLIPEAKHEARRATAGRR